MTPPLEPKPIDPPERRWRWIASLTIGLGTCGVAFYFWSWTLPGLWELATFAPVRPIRPMGFVAALFVSAFASMLLGFILGGMAASLSDRPLALRTAATAIGLSFFLPVLNVVAFVAILVCRGIELKG